RPLAGTARSPWRWDNGRIRRCAWPAPGRQNPAPGAAAPLTIALSMAWRVDRGPAVRSAARMASARFPDCRRPAAHGMERSLPYFTAPALVGGRSRLRPAGNRSNHHRYGEVKTRLTIDGTGQFAWYYHMIPRYYSEGLMA